MNAMYFRILPLTIVTTMVLSGCGMLPALDEVVPDNTQKYRKAETMPPLDIPPDLSTTRINDDIAGTRKGTATYSEFKEAETNPLASKYSLAPEIKPALSGEGEDRHLIVPSSEELTWQRLIDFSNEKAIIIKRQDSRIGLMDTAVGPDDYAYRFRVERGDTLKQSLVYVSAAGFDNNAQKNEAMLRQIADFVGTIHQQEKAMIAAEEASNPRTSVATTLVNEANGQALLVEQDFVDVWNRVGRILDSKGFSVEDRDRSRGTYFVHYIDPFNDAEKEEGGMLSKLAFWRDEVDESPEEFYNIKLISDAVNTKIIILDADLERSDTDTSKRLLSLLQEQLAK